MSEKDSPQGRRYTNQYFTGVALARPQFVAAAALAGFAFGARAALNALGEIRYWSPETPLEYTAVALLSVAMLFLGATLLALGSFWATHDYLPGRAAKMSWVAARVAGIAAVVVSVSNFLEDYLRLRWFGLTFVIGAIALLLSLLVASGLRLAPPRVDKVEGILLLAISAGVLLLSFSMAVGAAALLLLVGRHTWFRDQPRLRPPVARVM
ncbi:hypothetical protein [Pseudarthrobacter sp. NS4]|uniref:hypothetical protein n=1 Tax=Pseudarthrobacter sp. NS4 TaxID=2973976 RepID=UPI0021628AD8|nr:hypothetical protein [Pseudarthrobacter sp. NS4]